MERKSLLVRPERPFVRLGTLRGMAEVASRLARARKAVEEIREMEDLVVRKAPNSVELNQAMEDIKLLAETAAGAAGEAAGILRGMRPGAAAYLAEVEHAAD